VVLLVPAFSAVVLELGMPGSGTKWLARTVSSLDWAGQRVEKIFFRPDRSPAEDAADRRITLL